MTLYQEALEAKKRLDGVVYTTPLALNLKLSEEFDANIYLKREDLQVVPSYKIRGAYNKISQLTATERLNGIINGIFTTKCLKDFTFHFLKKFLN